MLSVIIPASNEEGYIADCLMALFASTPVPGGAEAVVVANGCRDATADRARAMAAAADNALNHGDRAAQGALRAYLDADVLVSPDLMTEIVAALGTPVPRYITGTARIPRAKSAVTRAYARLWQRLPFAQSTAPGYGLFAVNAEGRARWGDFPAIISDDTFVRLQFLPDERIQVPAPYDWPMIEGFAALTRVRRRQDAGVAEIDRLYPGLLEREAKEPLGLGGVARLAVSDPIGFATYAAVSVAVRLKRGSGWTRGR